MKHALNYLNLCFDNLYSIELTFRTVYWALFGMGEPNAVELGEAYSKAFTERLGYLVNGAYNFTTVIVLLNMLIAMMSRSYDQIQVSQLCSKQPKFVIKGLYHIKVYQMNRYCGFHMVDNKSNNKQGYV